MSNDSALASGALSENMFDNTEVVDEADAKAKKEREDTLAKFLEPAKQELARIDAELAKLDTLRDFISQLATPVIDMPEATIRNGLDARRQVMNSWLAYRNEVVDRLVDEGADPTEFIRQPLPFIPYEPVVKEITVVDPKQTAEIERLVDELAKVPRGWAAIVAGIRDLFRGRPMA